MLEFSDCYEETGQYKGVELNATRSNMQARFQGAIFFEQARKRGNAPSTIYFL